MDFQNSYCRSCRDNKIILELKAVFSLSPVMKAQIINYLRLSKVPVGYLVNFRNTRVQFKWFVSG
ncbi:MAG: hypothetical protein DRP59_05785 [Spirochaetes bacterium]|nr:MAG: hypothetical protein DRP59_05785 [Spirochaetota bacterium]